eukprot:9496136-Pyramimonas_sp.AAC.1
MPQAPDDVSGDAGGDGGGDLKRSLDELEEDEREQLFEAAKSGAEAFAKTLGDMAKRRKRS